MTDRWEDVIRRPSRARARWTPSRFAVREVVRFERRHGAVPLQLACHAALPSVVTPELVNLVRLNFLDRADVAWMTEVDFLLSPLCRELEPDEGIYQVEPAIREVLLAELEQQFGWPRLRQVARFLNAYVQATPVWRRRRDYSDVHRWIARAYLNPLGTAEDLQRELESSVDRNLDRWESMARQTELVALVEGIAEPLVRSVPSNVFGHLAGCARLVAHRVYESDPDWSDRHPESPDPTLDAVPLDQVAHSAVARWWFESAVRTPNQSAVETTEIPVGDQAGVETVEIPVAEPDLSTGRESFLNDLFQLARSQPDGLPYVAYDQALDIGLLAENPRRETGRESRDDIGSRQAMLQSVIRELEQRGQVFRLVVHERVWLVFPELMEDVAEERTELWGEAALRFAGSARAVLLAILVYYSSQGRYRITDRQRNSANVWDNDGPNMFVVSIAPANTHESGWRDLHLAIDATPEMTDVFRREVEDCVRQVAQSDSVVSLARDSIVAVPGMAIYNRSRQPREASAPVTCSLGGFVRLKDGRVALLTVGSRLHGQPGDEIVAAREDDRLLARLERSARPDKAGAWSRVDAAIAVLEPNVRPRATPRTPPSSGLADATSVRLGDEVVALGPSASGEGFVDALHVRLKTRGQPHGFGLRDVFSIRSKTQEPFASPRDAGSLVVRADGVVLGMIVATSDTAALACFIQDILEEFQCELITELPSDE